MNRRHGKPRQQQHRPAWDCRTTPDYRQLSEAAREQQRAGARTLALQAAQRYADLLVAEAGIAARAVYPTAGRLVFRLTTDVFGASATLVAAHTADGRQLWHIDTSDEWPDESLVSDYLAAAADVLDDYFPVASEGDATEEGDEVYAIDLD